MPQPPISTDALTPDYATVLADLNRLPDRAVRHLNSSLSVITKRGAETLKVSRANIWLFTDSTRATLGCVDNFDNNTKQHTHGMSLDAKSFPNYFAALEVERVIDANDAAEDERTKEFAAEYLPTNNIKSMLDAPIRQDGAVVGVLCLEQDGEMRHWTDAEATFVATLSDFATIALITHDKARAESALIQSQKMESLGRLSAGIAHDFNNILTVITGAVETLQLQATAAQGEQRLLSLIAEAGGRATKLTRSLLAFGGQQDLRFEPLNTTAILENVQALTEHVIREDIHVTFEPGDIEYWISGDETQLGQVLLNLLINSVDAMPYGGNLSIKVLPPNEQAQIGIAVTDTGDGMSENIQQRIFDPFFTTKGQSSSGLGLSISLGIMQQHGGLINCVSSSTQGTRFEILIPQSTPPLTSIDDMASSGEKTKASTSHRILLVEDEPAVRDIVAQMLRTAGYDVAVASDPEHALTIIKSQPVDLLVSDVVMPEMRGPDLYRKALIIKTDLSVLFVSGYSEEVIAEVADGDNRVGFLSKPFTMKQLELATRNLITESRGNT